MKHPYPRRTLYRRVYLHGLLLLVVVTAALGLAGFVLGRDARWRWHPTLLAQHVAGLVAALPEPSLPPLLARLADELEVDVVVYADDGRRVAAAGEQVAPPLDAAQLASLHRESRPLRSGPHLASAAAGAGRYVRVSVRRPEAGALLRLLGGLGFLVLVLAVASAPLARAITRPIEHLSQVARRLGEGDLAVRSHLERSDEIGALADTFDEMADRLGRLLEGQRDLLANVSHELRTPLARIRVALSLAAEAEPEQGRRHLREIEQDVVELERLVSDVLTATRLDGGGALVLRRERVDVARLVEEALVRLRRHRPGRRIEARLEPAPAVDAEPALLARVLDNLLDNAAKYSEPATPLVVELSAADRGALVTVRDQGIGIAPEDQPRVFTPFFRGDRSRTRDTGGVGLGLALSKRIVEAHGGRLALESAPGQGTVVTFWLPALGPSAGAAV